MRPTTAIRGEKAARENPPFAPSAVDCTAEDAALTAEPKADVAWLMIDSAPEVPAPMMDPPLAVMRPLAWLATDIAEAALEASDGADVTDEPVPGVPDAVAEAPETVLSDSQYRR